MQLSIIVPVYNMTEDQKLNQCLDSLLAQTISDYEIIAVDDASTDDSLSVLRQYEESYPGRVRVIAGEKNHRQGGAKNRGINAAQGEWIGFIDSDDWIAPDMYEKLITKAGQTGADLVGCDYSHVDGYTMQPGKVVVNNTAEQTGVLDAERHKKLLLCPGSMVVKIYRRQVIIEHHLDFPEDIFYEDNCASPLWSLYFSHFERVEEPLYFYRMVEGSTTHRVTWERCLDRMKAGELFLQECKKRGLYDTYRNEIEYWFTKIYYAATLFSYMYSGRRQKMKNTGALRKNIKKFVPDFQDNPYYKDMMPKEDQKLIALQMRSNRIFFLYYKLLFGYRRLREKSKVKTGAKAEVK